MPILAHVNFLLAALKKAVIFLKKGLTSFALRYFLGKLADIIKVYKYEATYYFEKLSIVSSGIFPGILANIYDRSLHI